MTRMILIAAVAVAGMATLAAVAANGRRMNARPDMIRNAGRRQMKMPPRSWDLVDESADASFPASDPPGNY